MENEKELEIVLDSEQDLSVEFKEEIVEVVTSDYNKLVNLPSINKKKLQGDKTLKELGLQEELETISNLEIEKILNI